MENKELIITPLGTVSTYCYDGKKCPGYLVQYGENKILLDCGNGISEYLNLPKDLNNLTIIISHLHPDHYGELLSIASTSYVFSRLGYLNERIKVYIPEGDKIKVTENYEDTDGWATSRVVEKNIIDFDYLLNLEMESYLEFIPYKQTDELNIDDLQISFAKNPHPLITYSTKLETEGIKLVYSSDTGYKGNCLEEFALNANLLICESTFLRGQIRNNDNHLFAHEAAIIAKKANVDKLVLTHFWPSIDKQKYVDEAREVFTNTEAAEEGKKINIKEKINMENYKSSSHIWLEKEEKEDKIALDSLNKFYFDNIIKPYRQSDKIIDLHTHTNYSDGDLSPSELIKLALEKRIGVLAITDHDTLEGIKKIDKSNPLIVDSGIEIINGIELSAKVSKGRMHILGYDIDINDIKLNKKMDKVKDISINSVLSIMEQIKRDYGIVFRYDDIKELVNSNHNLGRPDLAKLCVKYGYATSVQDAFDKYLIEAHNKTRSTSKGLPYEECIELILHSKGIPVLAHPKSLELSEKEFLILLKEMINFGLKGIEVYHSSHTADEIKYYLEIANKYNLLVSGGSDYHGSTVKPDIDLGTGKNHNIKIKSLSLVEYLKNR